VLSEGLQGQRRRDLEAALGAGARLESAADGVGAFPHAHDAEAPGRGGAGRADRAFVGDGDQQPGVLVGEVYVGGLRAGVLGDVGEAFLDDAVCRQVLAGTLVALAGSTAQAAAVSGRCSPSWTGGPEAGSPAA
jgi:hypothetical protein